MRFGNGNEITFENEIGNENVIGNGNETQRGNELEMNSRKIVEMNSGGQIMSKIIRESDKRQITLRLRSNSRFIRPSQKFHQKFTSFRGRKNHNANFFWAKYLQWDILHRFRGNSNLNNNKNFNLGGKTR